MKKNILCSVIFVNILYSAFLSACLKEPLNPPSGSDSSTDEKGAWGEDYVIPLESKIFWANKEKIKQKRRTDSPFSIVSLNALISKPKHISFKGLNKKFPKIAALLKEDQNFKKGNFTHFFLKKNKKWGEKL